MALVFIWLCCCVHFQNVHIPRQSTGHRPWKHNCNYKKNISCISVTHTQLGAQCKQALHGPLKYKHTHGTHTRLSRWYRARTEPEYCPRWCINKGACMTRVHVRSVHPSGTLFCSPRMGIIPSLWGWRGRSMVGWAEEGKREETRFRDQCLLRPVLQTSRVRGGPADVTAGKQNTVCSCVRSKEEHISELRPAEKERKGRNRWRQNGSKA